MAILRDEATLELLNMSNIYATLSRILIQAQMVTLEIEVGRGAENCAAWGMVAGGAAFSG